MPASKSFRRILAAPGNSIQPLIDHAQLLQTLTQVLRQGIDQPFTDHISLGNVRGDTAVITTDSPAWLNKIRYLGPVLLQLLHQQPGMHAVKNIQFKVAINSGDAASASRPAHRPVLSRHGAGILQSAAAGIKDPELAASLMRLADQAKGKETV